MAPSHDGEDAEQTLDTDGVSDSESTGCADTVVNIVKIKPAQPTNWGTQFVLFVQSPIDPAGMKVHCIAHPKSKSKAHFAVAGNTLLELQVVKKEYCSWFIDSSVERSGALYIATPVDPLLVLLPVLLEKVEGKFRTRQDVVEGYEFFQPFLSEELLRLVCTHRDIDGEALYRIDEEKLLAWLRLKLRKLAACEPLQQRYLRRIAAAGANLEDRQVHEQALLHVQQIALGLLGEYVPAAWMSRLTASLGLQPKAEEPAAALSFSGEQFTSAKRKAEQEEKENAKKKKQASSMNCKQLEKVDTRKMKSLTSFFGKK